MYARWLQSSALVLFGLVTIFLLSFGVIELALTDMDARGQLALASILIGLLTFAARRPRIAGWLLLAGGLAASLIFMINMPQPIDKFSGALISGGPLALVGLLFLAASRWRA